jgi:hypothetical protein
MLFADLSMSKYLCLHLIQNIHFLILGPIHLRL